MVGAGAVGAGAVGAGAGAVGSNAFDVAIECVCELVWTAIVCVFVWGVPGAPITWDACDGATVWRAGAPPVIEAHVIDAPVIDAPVIFAPDAPVVAIVLGGDGAATILDVVCTCGTIGWELVELIGIVCE